MSKNKQESKPAVQVKQLTLWEKIVRHRILILMCLPAIIYFIAFSYAPLPGIWVAFVKYNYRDGIFGSKFIGLDNFEFLATSGKLLELTKNTVLYNLAFILLGNFLAVFVAILLNEIQSKWFKKASQTVMFLPYFISQVLVGILVFYLLNYDTGLVNGILRNLGVAEESLWQPYSTPGVWPVLLVIIYLWQQTGYNSVVYFASIMGIDGEMMEAAKVDGCSDFGFFFKIAIPLSSTIIAVMALFYATAMWNQFFNALMYLQDDNKMPLQVVLRNLVLMNQANQMGSSGDAMITKQKLAEQLKYCIVVVSAVPLLVVYPFVQKYFVQGTMIGAVKG